MNLFSVKCSKNTIKKKRPGLAHFKKQILILTEMEQDFGASFEAEMKLIFI